MKRSQGGSDIQLLECINPRLMKWRVRWDVQPYVDPETGEERGVTFCEAEVNHKPTLAEIKETVTAGYNVQIDEKIKSGYTWKGMEVWLSTENQFNYKAAYDMAVQTSGESLPVTFKFGTNEEPQYHTFPTLEELTNFYTGAMAWVNQCLAEGWQTKDAIDWTKYNIEEEEEA